MEGFKFSNNQKYALLALVGLALVGLAYGKLRSSRSEPLSNQGITVTDRADRRGVEIDGPGDAPRGTENNSAPTVTVDVKGCVNKPGLYSLPAGSRINDAIKAAGGQSAEADINAVNRASTVKDGDQIIVPAKQAAASMPAAPERRGSYAAPPSYTASPQHVASVSGYGSMPTSGSRSKPAPTVVNINTAGPVELDALPGVGPATAQKIIDYRKQIGGFTSVDQLLDVKGIGPKKLEQMRPYVAL